MRKLLAAIGIAVLVALGGSVAYASIPAADGAIKTCYRDAGIGQGALHVIDSEATCPSGFTELSFNQVGQPGVSSYEVVTNTVTVTSGSAQTATADVNCPIGKKALGGGASGGNDELVRNTEPILTGGDATGWRARVREADPNSSASIVAQVWAICAEVEA